MMLKLLIMVIGVDVKKKIVNKSYTVIKGGVFL